MNKNKSKTQVEIDNEHNKHQVKELTEALGTAKKRINDLITQNDTLNTRAHKLANQSEQIESLVCDVMTLCTLLNEDNYEHIAAVLNDRCGKFPTSF